MAQGKGQWVSKAPYRAFGPIAVASAVAVYGPAANTVEMDAFMVTVAAANATLLDQNGMQTVFAAIPVGIYEMSPASFVALGGGTFIPLYR